MDRKNMNSIDFCFWLQGFFEMSGSNSMTDDQVEILKNHLNLTFKHEIDPLRESQTTASEDELNSAHTGNSHFFNNGKDNDENARC